MNYNDRYVGSWRFLAASMMVAGVLLAATPASAKTYEVGPGKPLVNIGDVPWYNLAPGDTVLIHYRAAPYYEKFLISSRGTPTAWIRILGVPGPNGELPIISGNNAKTSRNARYRWQDATGGNAIQWLGVIQVAVGVNDPTSGTSRVPGYIEIANLQVQDGYKDYRFTAENGSTANYSGFAACIYSRSVQNIIIRDNVLTNCGQGFYNWTGSGASSNYWESLQLNTLLRGNYFYNNGQSGSDKEHQTYTESDGVTIEFNRYGPMRSGALGSQMKDRSAGTVIRNNYVESAAGWMMDLVEPQESFPALGSRDTYKQSFVYGNVMVNRGSQNLVHWNEDQQRSVGRASVAGGKLFFYHNTVLTIANRSELYMFSLFNTNHGGYECPPGAQPGVIDVRNNIFAVLPRTAGAALPQMKFAYCSSQNFSFGRNWATAGWITGTSGRVEGLNNLVSSQNTPGFVSASSNDLHLVAGSPAVGIGGSLAPEVAANALGLNLSAVDQYVHHQLGAGRPQSSTPDAGAFSYPPVLLPGKTAAQVGPSNLRIVR